MKPEPGGPAKTLQEERERGGGAGGLLEGEDSDGPENGAPEREPEQRFPFRSGPYAGGGLGQTEDQNQGARGGGSDSEREVCTPVGRARPA